MVPKREGDPDELQVAGLRDPIKVTLSQAELLSVIGVGRSRLFWGAIFAAVLTGALVSVVMGLWVIRPSVVDAVRRDVNRAAVFNCGRTNRASTVGPALKSFLTTDATLNARLGRLDRKNSRIEADLSRRLRPFPLPTQIAQDYFSQSRIFGQLAGLREQVAGLWAGMPAKAGQHATRHRSPSLAQDVLTVTHVNCDRVLLP